MDEAVRSSPAPSERDASTADSFVPAGTQTLVRTRVNTDPLSVLPDRAFDNLLVVAVRNHPKTIRRYLERGGHEPSTVGVVPVIPAADEYDGELWTTDSVRPDDLTGIGMRFSDAMQYVESGTGWVLVDALGVLLTYSEDSRVCRFFQTLSNRVRARDAHGVYCLDPDATDERTYEQLRSMCDTEYEVE